MPIQTSKRLTTTSLPDGLSPMTLWLLRTPGAQVTTREFRSLPISEQRLLRRLELKALRAELTRLREQLSRNPFYANRILMWGGDNYLKTLARPAVWRKTR